MRAPRFAKVGPSTAATAALLAACLASAATARLDEQRAGSAAEHSSQGVERREPWPLRPDPRSGAEDAGCPAGAHYLFHVGGLALRLGPGIRWTADPVERRPPTWRSDLPRCGDGRTLDVRVLYIRVAAPISLPQDCWATGVPPGPDGPACASTPEGLRVGRAFFALGLPYDITLYELRARAVPHGEDARLRGLTNRARTALGNEEFRAPLPHRPDLDGGYPTYRLPRTGEGADALGPLLVACDGLRWPDPIPPARVPSPQICQVTFDAPSAGVRVNYRFPREVYDEPDWQALDLRVREWIAARATAGALR